MKLAAINPTIRGAKPLTLFILMMIVAGLSQFAAASTVKKHALLIDISRYDHLRFQTNRPSMTGLRSTLFEEGYDVKLLENGGRREVVQAIHNLTYNIDVDDTVLIVLQGGVAMTDRSDDVYIVFEDTRVDDLEIDGLTLSGLDMMLDRYNTPNQLLILMLDTLGTKVYGSEKQAPSRYLQPIRDDVQTSIAAQLSLLGEERALLSEIDARDDKSDDPNSLSTLLLNGVRGSADTNGDNIVEVQELQHYVEQHSTHAPIVLGQDSGEIPPSAKLVRTTPIEEIGVSATAPIATRSFTLAVLSDEMAAQHKKVLADWVVEGLLSRKDNLRLYGLMSHVRGKNESDIDAECLRAYRALEPMLQNAFELQKDYMRTQLQNLVIADKMKQQLQKVPASCTKK